MRDAPHTARTNSVFEESWWLEAVAPGQWREAVVRTDSALEARLPFVVKRRALLTMVVQPPLTPALGPWFGALPERYARRIARERELIDALLSQLPQYHVFEQSLSPSFLHAMPFAWQGFDVSARWTYRLDDLSDVEAVWSEFLDPVRRAVRKAKRSVEVRESEDVGPLIELSRLSLMRGGAPPLEDGLLRRVDEAAGARGCRSLLYAYDSSERVNAAALFVWDADRAYYLLSGRDERQTNLGAGSLLLWEAIQAAAARGLAFDFAGSMLPAVERFVRGFGGRQVPYLHVSRRRGRGHAWVSARRAWSRWSAR